MDCNLFQFLPNLTTLAVDGLCGSYLSGPLYLPPLLTKISAKGWSFVEKKLELDRLINEISFDIVAEYMEIVESPSLGATAELETVGKLPIRRFG